MNFITIQMTDYKNFQDQDIKSAIGNREVQQAKWAEGFKFYEPWRLGMDYKGFEGFLLQLF